MTAETKLEQPFVLGQRFAFATAALLVGIGSYVSLLGMEKGILAILFAILALKSSPAPRLTERRAWAYIGLALGATMILLVPTMLLLYRERVGELIAALERLQ
jgi:tellurite resistance protein TehA-like permease